MPEHLIPRKTVFLSSVAQGLEECRDAAYRAIEGLDGYHCDRMEDFGARDAPPIELSTRVREILYRSGIGRGERGRHPDSYVRCWQQVPSSGSPHRIRRDAKAPHCISGPRLISPHY